MAGPEAFGAFILLTEIQRILISKYIRGLHCHRFAGRACGQIPGKGIPTGKLVNPQSERECNFFQFKIHGDSSSF